MPERQTKDVVDDHRNLFLTEVLTIPEGFTLRQMAERIGVIALRAPDSVLAELTADSLHQRWGVLGPGLEGYLFPDTYRFAWGTAVEEVVRAMVARYREEWTLEKVRDATPWG